MIIASVGGTIEPVVYLLNSYKPKYITFFCSKESAQKLSEIIKSLEYNPQNYEKVETENAEDMLKCYKVLRYKIPEILSKYELTKEDILIDYTGGTKTMSAALVLASIDISSEFSYVGGKERNKDGLGVVISGAEELVKKYNPYEFYLIDQARKIEMAFNTCKFRQVIDIIKEIENRILGIGEDILEFYSIIERLSYGYMAWDNFDHKKAEDEIGKGFSKLKIFAVSSGKYKDFAKCVENNLNFLNTLNKEKKEKGISDLLVADLIANAKRRADFEGRLDDAVARLYRTLEKIAQNELKKILGADNSKVNLEQIPEKLKVEFKEKYYDEKIKKCKLPLSASYELLYHLNNEKGRKFKECKEKLEVLLDKRNNSILAHGDTPISEEVYKDLLNTILHFSELKEEDLPKFPTLPRISI